MSQSWFTREGDRSYDYRPARRVRSNNVANFGELENLAEWNTLNCQRAPRCTIRQGCDARDKLEKGIFKGRIARATVTHFLTGLRPDRFEQQEVQALPTTQAKPLRPGQRIVTRYS